MLVLAAPVVEDAPDAGFAVSLAETHKLVGFQQGAQLVDKALVIRQLDQYLAVVFAAFMNAASLTELNVFHIQR